MYRMVYCVCAGLQFHGVEAIKVFWECAVLNMSAWEKSQSLQDQHTLKQHGCKPCVYKMEKDNEKQKETSGMCWRMGLLVCEG